MANVSLKKKDKDRRNARRRERYATDQEHREKIKANSKKTKQLRSPEKREEERATARRKHAENMKIPAFRENRRAVTLRYLYGVTAEQYRSMYAEQCGKCKCCGKHKKKLCVDHDHKTKVVRGLLCQLCNHCIGGLGDNVDGLMRAVNYLRSSVGGSGHGQ